LTKLPELRKALAYKLSQPVVRLLARTPITPNFLSWFGFMVTIGAAILIAIGHIFAAGFVVLLAGFFDILDGALARSTEQITLFGGILDSTLDRMAEVALLLGILAHYAGEPSVTGVLLAGVALSGSLLVSYIRARAEAAGLECQEGLFTRAERVVVLALGLLLNQIILVLAIIALLSFITAGQRLVHAWQQTRNK